MEENYRNVKYRDENRKLKQERIRNKKMKKHA